MKGLIVAATIVVALISGTISALYVLKRVWLDE
jgi:hypothetical protein